MDLIICLKTSNRKRFSQLLYKQQSNYTKLFQNRISKLHINIAIINTSNPTPKFVFRPKPSFRTELERKRWWGKERETWIDGDGDGAARISGMHKFYLTQCFIKSGTGGAYIRPRYRDCDEWIIEPIHDSFWN